MIAFIEFATTLADYFLKGLIFLTETFLGLLLMAAGIAGMVALVRALGATA